MILSVVKEGFPITQKFGARPEFYKKYGMIGHDGIDYWTPTGTSVYAPFDWVVQVKDQWERGYWLYIVITESEDLSERRQVYLAHLSKTLIKDWVAVKAWEEIARTGNSGNSSGSHLHQSIRRISSDWRVLNIENGMKWREDIYEKNWILAYTPSAY